MNNKVYEFVLIYVYFIQQILMYFIMYFICAYCNNKYVCIYFISIYQIRFKKIAHVHVLILIYFVYVSYNLTLLADF